MTRKSLILLTCLWAALPTPSARANEADACEPPEALLASEAILSRVEEAARKQRIVNIAVVGSGSSILGGREGASVSYPERLEADLKKRLPGVQVTVTAYAKPRMSAAEIELALERLVIDTKPHLVIWQTGTVDAIRGIGHDEFQATLSVGVSAAQREGADVVLMNMQYSPRTESMIAIGAYDDVMRAVAYSRQVPLFDRFAIMRHWNETGLFDFSVATKSNVVAQRVHDCIARALSSLIIDTARLRNMQAKNNQQ